MQKNFAWNSVTMAMDSELENGMMELALSECANEFKRWAAT